MVRQISRWWTELSTTVGILATVLSFVNGLGFVPAPYQHYLGIAVAVLTWLAINVFHREAMTMARLQGFATGYSKRRDERRR